MSLPCFSYGRLNNNTAYRMETHHLLPIRFTSTHPLRRTFTFFISTECGEVLPTRFICFCVYSLSLRAQVRGMTVSDNSSSREHIFHLHIQRHRLRTQTMHLMITRSYHTFYWERPRCGVWLRQIAVTIF